MITYYLKNQEMTLLSIGSQSANDVLDVLAVEPVYVSPLSVSIEATLTLLRLMKHKFKKYTPFKAILKLIETR